MAVGHLCQIHVDSNRASLPDKLLQHPIED